MAESSEEGHEYLTLGEVQAELLSMLKVVGSWFEEQGFRYSLVAGTLLGAVRHHGFIPWDDDIDLGMPRPDYERLLAMSDELKRATGFGIVSCRDGSYYYPYAKITNPSIRAQEECVEGVYEGYLWLDIFPIDGVPDNDVEYKKLINYRYLRIKLINLALTKGSRSKAKSLVKAALRPMVRLFVDPYKLAAKIEKNNSRFPYETANLVAGGAVYVDKSISREGFENTVMLPFGDAEFPCMSCWDEYLTKSYGDYMQLPPEGERLYHPQKTWRVKAGANE